MTKFLNISTDNTLGGNSPSDEILSSQKAIKHYIDTAGVGANKSLSNLDSTGQNIANWSTNVTNCITEIPQNINLELNNGTLTLKSGSKVYVPNGSGVFNVVTIPSDKTFSTGSANNKLITVYYPGDGTIKTFLPENVVSGSSYSISDGIWYDTTNNIIKRISGGNVAYSGLSFPIGMLQSTSGTLTSIDQVFNGFGYIGHHSFLLPGVKFLIPNGFNADGTLNNTVVTRNSVYIRELSGSETAGGLYIQTNGVVYTGVDKGSIKSRKELSSNGVYYVENENKNVQYYNNTYQEYGALAGTYTSAGGVITSFDIKTPFRAVDYNDLPTVALSGAYNDLIGKPTDLFDVKWSDHLLDDTSWLRADNFSWNSGVTYSAAYNHLVADIAGKTLQSETIGGTTVQFYLANDGHKICPASQESNVLAIYNATGVAWYYVIDSANTRFKLPRTKFGITGFRDTVGNYVAPTLPNITAQFNTSGTNQAGSGAITYTQVSTGARGWDGVGAVNGQWDFNANTINSIYQNDATVQPPATQMYLYFYVGAFTRTALENTAGLNASLFNGKADVNLLNTASNVDFVIETKEPTAENDYTWYRKYKSGWVEQGGFTSSISDTGTVNLLIPMSDSSYQIQMTVSALRPDGTTFSTDGNWLGFCWTSKTTTGFTVRLMDSDSTGARNNGPFYWEVKGMTA